MSNLHRCECSICTFRGDEIERLRAAKRRFSYLADEHAKAVNELRQRVTFLETSETNELHRLRNQLSVARKGIQDYLNGDYPHPRSFRPGKCPHGLYYYNECEQCTDDHFAKVLSSLTDKPGK